MDDWLWWLRFSRLNLSSRRQMSLLEHFHSPQAIFSAPAEEIVSLEGLEAAVAAKIRAVRETFDAEAEWAELQRRQIRLLNFYEADYPAPLKTIADPPPLLFVQGTLEPQDHPAVAIVGSRRGSPYGRLVAENLARGLATQGVTVVSGLARGIDTAAHQGALRGGGRTIAVLGCGLDVNYPRENRALAEEISAHGARITEFPLGTQPEGWRFPARNRLISGLAQAVVIVEAPLNSGALITADFALEQGREVLAVPGNVTNNRNAGCHRLLKEGARLVEDVFDILEVLGRSPQPSPPVPAEDPRIRQLSPVEKQLLEALDSQQKHVDVLSREAHLSPAEINATLLVLELKGLVRRLPGNVFMRSS